MIIKVITKTRKSTTGEKKVQKLLDSLLEKPYATCNGKQAISVSRKENEIHASLDLRILRKCGLSENQVSIAAMQFLNDVSDFFSGKKLFRPGVLLKSRDIQKKICPVCGKEFIGGGKRIYCSEACKQRARWDRLDK